MTVTRIIGEIRLFYTVNITVTDSLSIVDCGIGVSSVEAFNAGGAALPEPTVETEYPPRGWLYVASQPVYEKVATEGIALRDAVFKFDLRGMRKVDKGILFLTLKQENITIGGSMQVVGRVRTLCKT